MRTVPQDSVHESITLEKLYPLQEIVVTSIRIPGTQDQVSSSSQIFLKDELENSNSTSLAGILSSVGGMFIKEYGGVSGLKTISQRGMGTEHTLVLVNGLRVSSSQNGLVDLGLFSLDNMERVEVLSGGSSAAYGSDAVAGVINVLTNISPTNHHVKATSAFGSFGYKRIQVLANVATDPMLVQGAYGEEKSEEDYPFLFTNGNATQTVVRQNSDLRAQFGSVNGVLRFGEETRMNVLLYGYGSKRGVGGSVLSPASTNHARQHDEDMLIQLGLTSKLSSAFELSTHAQGHYAYQRYRDPDLSIGGITVDNYFANLDLRLETQANVVLNEDISVCVGGELARVTAKGNSLKSDVTREQAALFGTGKLQLLSEMGFVSRVGLHPGIRFDVQTGSLRAWSPQLGAILSFARFGIGVLQNIDLSLHSNISRNFRNPTFNELYFTGGGGVGNPSLQPERSISFDAGIRSAFEFLGKHQFQASYFRISMQDRIVWVAAGSGMVSPKNLRQVRSEGLELSNRYGLLSDAIVFKTAFTHTQSTKISVDYPGDPTVGKRLIYIPEQTLQASLSLVKRWEEIALTEVAGEIGYSFVGFRYFTEDNTGFLPSYRLVHTNLRARLGLEEFVFFAKFEINNLFNEDYQVTPGYPMPLRSYRLTVTVER